MYNRKKAILSAAIILTVSACSRNTAEPVTDTAPDTSSAIISESTSEAYAEASPYAAAEVSESTVTAVPETPESTEETSAETTSEQVQQIEKPKPVYSLKPSDKTILTANDEETKLFEGNLQIAAIDNESEYPQLAQALSDYAEQRKVSYENSCKELSELVNEHFEHSPDSFKGEYPMSYYCSIDNTVSRCDDKVFSFINSEEGYSGGAHGWFISRGLNFDAQTGNMLTADDICTDIPRLVDILAEKLENEYKEAVDPSYSNADNYRQILTKAYGEDLQGYDAEWDDGTVYHMDAMNFVFVPDGVAFFSNSYDLTSYAGGTQQLTVLFSEAEGLFDEKYVSSGEDFDITGDLYLTMYVDIDGDGKGDIFTVNENFDDEWNITGCTV